MFLSQHPLSLMRFRLRAPVEKTASSLSVAADMAGVAADLVAVMVQAAAAGHLAG